MEMAYRYDWIDCAAQARRARCRPERCATVDSGAHDETRLTALCGALVELEVCLVAIERPDGLLVERLLDAGLRGLALHPNKVAAARDRFRVSGGKPIGLTRVAWRRRALRFVRTGGLSFAGVRLPRLAVEREVP
jgi:hypothetical protein